MTGQKHFPSWRFSRYGGESKIIQTPEEDALLGPEWRDSPWPPNSPPPADVDEGGKAVETTPEVTAEPSAPIDNRAAEVHAASAKMVAEKVEQITDIPFLEELLVMEIKHPKFEGGRKGVLEAISARIHAVTKA